MNEITMLYFILGFFGAHNVYLSWKLWQYRKAIIQLQKDIWEPHGVVDEVTKPVNQTGGFIMREADVLAFKEGMKKQRGIGG